MYCPACGANIKQQDQKYCQDCGATLPAQAGSGTAIAPRGTGVDLPVPGRRGRGGVLHLLPVDLRNRLLIGAGAAVLAVFVLYVVISAIVSFLLHLVLPAVVVLAVVYAGYRFISARAS